jgi:hypothetical protein
MDIQQNLLTKSLHSEGGAIIAGYNGNPENKEIFDSSQHFSSVISWSDLKIIDENTTNKLEELEVRFTQICITNNLKGFYIFIENGKFFIRIIILIIII